jgi:hypothetical protein
MLSVPLLWRFSLSFLVGCFDLKILLACNLVSSGHEIAVCYDSPFLDTFGITTSGNLCPDGNNGFFDVWEVSSAGCVSNSESSFSPEMT